MIRCRLSFAWVLAVCSATALPAQVVRGRVTERNTTASVAGALVSLLGDAHDSTIVSVLTSPAGDYAVRAPVPGRYRLAVKRIGVRRFVSSSFDLGDGETRALDVGIDPVALSLPPVTVSGLCATRPRELARIASLWEEARTALEATEISMRDRLMQAQISRYAGELDPTTLRALFDWRSDAEMMVSQPFTSLSGDSLSAVGYWRVLPGDSVEYLAPDASALSSNAFLRDHCFTLAGAPRGRPDLVGLGFGPARDRVLPDIRGTIWIDAKKFELRYIEFRYTRLPDIPDADRVGGEVHFARLSTGAWIVDRWFIRMPQVVVLPNQIAPRRQLREEGGTVVTDGFVPSIPPSTVTGVLRDSGGRPVAGATIRAIGTHRQAVTGPDGTYRLDSLPPGSVSVVAHTNGYDSFAVLAATRRVELQPGRSQRIDLRSRDSGAIRDEACPDPNLRYLQRARVRGALRLLLVDSASLVPMPGVRFVVSWPMRNDAALRRMVAPVGRGWSGQQQTQQALTDSRGTATFCDLPYGFPVEVLLPGPTGAPAHVMMVELASTGITGRVVYGRINR
jgi:hypothetical protein